MCAQVAQLPEFHFLSHLVVIMKIHSQILPNPPVSLTYIGECAPPPPKRPALDHDSQTDAAQIISSPSLSASSRYNLLTNHFQPSADYIFPKGACGCSFQYRWLQSFPWLVYSKQEDGGFCLPCVLFALPGYRRSNPGVLVSRPLKVFKKALETLRKHADKDHHQTAIVRANEFKMSMSNQQPNIEQRLSKSLVIGMLTIDKSSSR